MSMISGIPEGYGGIDLTDIDSDIYSKFVDDTLKKAQAEAYKAKANKEDAFEIKGVNQNVGPKTQAAFSEWYSRENNGYKTGYMQSMANGVDSTNHYLEGVKRTAKEIFENEISYQDYYAKYNEKPEYNNSENEAVIKQGEDFYDGIASFEQINGASYFVYTPEHTAKLYQKYGAEIEPYINNGMLVLPHSSPYLDYKTRKLIPSENWKEAADKSSKSLPPDSYSTEAQFMKPADDSILNGIYEIVKQDGTKTYVKADRILQEAFTSTIEVSYSPENIVKGSTDEYDLSDVIPDDISLTGAGIDLYDANHKKKFGDRPFSKLSKEEKLLAANYVFDDYRQEVENGIGTVTRTNTSGTKAAGGGGGGVEESLGVVKIPSAKLQLGIAGAENKNEAFDAIGITIKPSSKAILRRGEKNFTATGYYIGEVNGETRLIIEGVYIDEQVLSAMQQGNTDAVVDAIAKAKSREAFVFNAQTDSNLLTPFAAAGLGKQIGRDVDEQVVIEYIMSKFPNRKYKKR